MFDSAPSMAVPGPTPGADDAPQAPPLRGLLREALYHTASAAGHFWPDWRARVVAALGAVGVAGHGHCQEPESLPEAPPRARDYMVGGAHYHGHAMQPWDIVDAWSLDYYEGNALKYLLRRKPGAPRSTDLRKAQHYLERAIERALSAEGAV
ncbi:DUF3310 domain-containing protein [uncultured Thiodictyon sp.]|uniref:DUF3310 domain-containing protein n=1 Tax=uncultured Thiodictyon sp. TaxID=1846217 RepID=UPI0025E418A7|nr:DUF3310 domain-containing protein [uncultured Thiodictyon sp.]